MAKNEEIKKLNNLIDRTEFRLSSLKDSLSDPKYYRLNVQSIEANEQVLKVLKERKAYLEQRPYF